MYKYNLSFNTHFKNAWGVLIYLPISVMIPFILVYRYDEEDSGLYVFLSIIFFLIWFLPHLIIHLKYYFLNRRHVLYYDQADGEIIFENDSINYRFTFEQIDSIDRYMSFPLAENRFDYFPWDNYNYSVIHLKNGQRFIVTSLLVPNLDLPLPPEKIKLRKRFYCYPFNVKENFMPNVV